MELMGIVAVIVNLALLGIGGSLSRMFPSMTTAERIILIIVIEVINTLEYPMIQNGIAKSFIQLISMHIVR